MKGTIYFIVLVLSVAVFGKPFLIGGEVVKKDDLRSTLLFGGCTASKIGDHLILTAAHCVIDPSGKIRYPVNSKELISTHFAKDFSVTIEKYYIHDTYLDFIVDGDQGGAFKSFDIAVVVTKEKMDTIETGKVSFDYIYPGQSVYITGYGCIDNIFKGTLSENLELKLQRTAVARPLKTAEDFYKRDISRSNSFNILTYGKRKGILSALCSGDSGGALYREIDEAIIGVNSQFIFNDDSGVAFLNTHTRISYVRHWLKDILEKYTKVSKE